MAVSAALRYRYTLSEPADRSDLTGVLHFTSDMSADMIGQSTSAISTLRSLMLSENMVPVRVRMVPPLMDPEVGDIELTMDSAMKVMPVVWMFP